MAGWINNKYYREWCGGRHCISSSPAYVINALRMYRKRNIVTSSEYYQQIGFTAFNGLSVEVADGAGFVTSGTDESRYS